MWSGKRPLEGCETFVKKEIIERTYLKKKATIWREVWDAAAVTADVRPSDCDRSTRRLVRGGFYGFRK